MYSLTYFDITRVMFFLVLMHVIWWHKSPQHFTPYGVSDYLNYGYISEPGEYSRPPWAFRWRCPADVGKVRLAMNHLELNALKTGSHMVTAPEYGINLAMAYFRNEKLFVINPAVIDKSTETIQCKYDMDGKEETKTRPKWIKISHLGGDLRCENTHITQFSGRGSCEITTLIDQEYAKQPVYSVMHSLHGLWKHGASFFG